MNTAHSGKVTPIILLVGKSGCGKTTATQILKEKYGWKDISSYTTRPPRHPGEAGHIFITEDEFDRIPQADIGAYAEFDGHRYCATNKQIDAADIYVIDVAGIKYLKAHYTGKKKTLIVYIDVTQQELVRRMKQRGDSREKIAARLAHDSKAFKEALMMADYVVNGGMDPSAIARELVQIRKEVEGNAL